MMARSGPGEPWVVVPSVNLACSRGEVFHESQDLITSERRIDLVHGKSELREAGADPHEALQFHGNLFFVGRQEPLGEDDAVCFRLRKQPMEFFEICVNADVE